MNPRIRELAEQAGLKYHNWINNESNVNNGDFKYPRLEDYKKFAELIVQECVEVGQHEFLHGSTVPVFPAIQIKQHFGVKE